MLHFERGRLWLGLFAREWWNWRVIRNRSGLHGYRLWWHVGPLQLRWGCHVQPCSGCEEVLKRSRPDV